MHYAKCKLQNEANKVCNMMMITFQHTCFVEISKCLNIGFLWISSIHYHSQTSICLKFLLVFTVSDWYDGCFHCCLPETYMASFDLIWFLIVSLIAILWKLLYIRFDIDTRRWMHVLKIVVWMAYSGHKVLFLICLRHHFYKINFGGIHMNLGNFTSLP